MLGVLSREFHVLGSPPNPGVPAPEHTVQIAVQHVRTDP